VEDNAGEKKEQNRYFSFRKNTEEVSIDRINPCPATTPSDDEQLICTSDSR
jgi:hypothetical protein